MRKKTFFTLIGVTVALIASLTVLIQPAAAFEVAPGHSNGVPAVVVIPVQEPGEWVRAGSFYGKTGNAGYGWINFTINNVIPASATLTINGVGTFDITNIICVGVVKKTCTGMISGLPFGGTPTLHGGTLDITTPDNEHIKSQKSGLQVPPAPAP